MALDTFVAGRYSATWPAAQDLGITGGGYELQPEFDLEEIGESDAYGTTVIDGIFRGGNCHIQFESLAYKAASIASFWPYGGALGANGVLGVLVDPTVAGTKAPIGILASDHARTLLLTATAGTPAAASPATLSATKALLAKNNNPRLLFNSKLRNVPIRMRLWPFDAGSAIIKFFTTT